MATDLNSSICTLSSIPIRAPFEETIVIFVSPQEASLPQTTGFWRTRDGSSSNHRLKMEWRILCPLLIYEGSNMPVFHDTGMC